MEKSHDTAEMTLGGSPPPATPSLAKALALPLLAETESVQPPDEFVSDLNAVQFMLPSDLVQSLRRNNFRRSASELTSPPTSPELSIAST